MSQNKKLNNFNPKSTHYAIDSSGELKFLTICPKLNAKPAEYWLLDQPKRISKSIGVFKAVEFIKYKM